MGDEGYESTLLGSNKSYRGISSPPTMTTRPSTKSKPKMGGIHARMIDEHREASLSGDVKDDATSRQLRRRMYRLTLERNVSMDEKRRKMMIDDVDLGRGNKVYPVEEAGEKDSIDVLPTPNRLPSKTVTSPTDSIFSRPPPPPTTTPSYRAIVTNLIRNNEPEKLSQIDRVMIKYAGREEELIGKLDLRYRKKRKQNKVTAAVSTSGPKSVSDVSQGQSELSQSVDERGTIESPKKDRSAIQVMQSWDRKHTETSEEDIAVTKSDPAEQRGSEDLGVSARTSSTRTEIHSNMEKDVIDDEGRLPKVPESKAIDTPTRPIEKTTQGSSPAFNDDISLITMETKGTLNRNRPTEGGEAVYSYTEMMRRPPASIIVDGGSSSQQGMGSSPASNNSGDGTKRQQQFAPPRIQRLLPEYEKSSEVEKAKNAEISSDAAAKLDSVEARILARRQLREEQARISEDEQPQPKAANVKTLDENSTMAFDEEESFVGKSNNLEEAPGAIDNSFSLIESEAQRGAEAEEDKLDTTLIRDNTAAKAIDEPSFEAPLQTDPEQSMESKSIPTRITDEDIPLDELNDSIQVGPRVEQIPDEEKPLDETNATESSYLTCIQSPQPESKPNLSPVEQQDCSVEEVAAGMSQNDDNGVPAANRDAEIQLKAMEDEIARLIAEKESRFAAENAVALQEAEQALEEVSFLKLLQL